MIEPELKSVSSLFPIFQTDSHLLPNTEQKPRYCARFSMKKKHFLLVIMINAWYKYFLKNQIIDAHINQFESILTKAVVARTKNMRTH